jgi:hypothetical protein
MKVVVDTNRLRSQELWGFLTMSPENLVVLPDYVLMEVFKTGQPDEVRTSFSILGQFAGQVLALRGTGDVSTLNPDAADVREAMISKEETAEFPAFTARLAGRDRRIEAAIAQRTLWSRQQMDLMLAGFSDMAPAFEEFAAPFSREELRLIRTEQLFTPEMTRKFLGLTAAMAEAIFEARGLPLPSLDARPEHFIFRNCLCYAVYMMERTRQGARTRKGEIARNDAIDVMLAAYGTYFDGVMSHDRLTNEAFHISRYVLQQTGGTTGGDYLADGLNDVCSFLERQPEGARFGGAAEP